MTTTYYPFVGKYYMSSVNDYKTLLNNTILPKITDEDFIVFLFNYNYVGNVLDFYRSNERIIFDSTEEKYYLIDISKNIKLNIEVDTESSDFVEIKLINGKIEKFISETKLLEYENKYKKLFDDTKNKILSDFNKINENKTKFKYTIVRDRHNKLEKNIIENNFNYFSLIHELMTTENYVNATVEFTNIELTPNKFKIIAKIVSLKKNFDKENITIYQRKQNHVYGELYENCEIIFDFASWMNYKGFENISSCEFEVNHMIANKNMNVIVNLSELEDYNKKLVDWIARYF